MPSLYTGLVRVDLKGRMFALTSLELEDAATNDHRGIRDDASIKDCLTPDEEISDEEGSSSGDSSSSSDETSTATSVSDKSLLSRRPFCQT